MEDFTDFYKRKVGIEIPEDELIAINLIAELYAVKYYQRKLIEKLTGGE